MKRIAKNFYFNSKLRPKIIAEISGNQCGAVKEGFLT